MAFKKIPPLEHPVLLDVGVVGIDGGEGETQQVPFMHDTGANVIWLHCAAFVHEVPRDCSPIGHKFDGGLGFPERQQVPFTQFAKAVVI